MAEPSILGALRDPQFRSDTLRNLVEALNGAKRSLTVGSLGAVGDMGNTLANLVRAGAGTAYHETTGRPIPQALEYRDPARDFGTSAHLGGIAERQGWLPPQTFSMPEQAGALLGPIVAMKAPDLAQSTLRGLVSALKSEPSRRMVEGLVDGMGARPKIFAGEGAQTADMQALAKAQQLEKAGTPERAIWFDTGWFRGADKKWRFEIDDSGARLRDYNFTPQEAFQNTPYANRAEMAPYASKSKADLVSEYKRTGGLIADAATRGDTDKAMQMLQDRSGLDKLFEAMRSRTYGPASSFMAHGELGAAYPDVYKLHTRIDNDLSGLQGQYLRGDRTQGEQIVLGSKPKWSDGKSTLLHELQHAVQQREGFAAGGNPSSISLLDMVPAETIESVKQSPLYRLQVAQGRDPKKALEGILAPYLDEFGGGNAGNARMDAYRRLAGEAEARAVQSRMDMTPEQRRATFPFDSYDVPRDKLILRDLLKGPAQATETRLNAVTKPEYGIDHRPMTVEGGASQLHDLTPSFGDDIYGPNALQFFGSGDPREKSVVGLLKKIRGNPDALVTIYRGVPDGAPQTINPGDWITLDKNAASDYGRVVEMKVPASHVTSWADSLLEFGYYPPGKKP